MDRRDVLRMAAASLALPLTSRLRAANPEPILTGRIELRGQRVVMPVAFGESGTPLPFLIDTGTVVSIIDDALARELRLTRTGTTNLGGIGGPGTYPLYLAREVVVGGAVRQPSAAFAGRPGGFGEFRGALAAGILTSIDSDLDLSASAWRLYPQGRRDRPGFVLMRGGIVGGQRGESARLFADAEVNGTSLRFLIDTGAPGGLSLHEHAAARLGLWNAERSYSPQRTRGIGGPGGLGRLVRIQQLTFAGRRFDRPVILLRRDGKSHVADGIIGLGLLRGFNLSTEVAKRALWVQPHATPVPLPEDYNRAGLWLEQKRGGVEVIDVGAGSPAQRAGVRVGDRVSGLFDRLVDTISKPAGTAVTLSLERAGTTRTVSFSLEDYL